MGICNLILSIVVVPDINESVHPGEEEKSNSGRTPASVSQVGWMIFGLHDGGLQVFGPDLGSPISNGQEVLGEAWIPLDFIDWSMMLSRFKSVSLIDFDWPAWSLVGLEDVSLLGSDQVFEWLSINCKVLLQLRCCIQV